MNLAKLKKEIRVISRRSINKTSAKGTSCLCDRANMALIPGCRAGSVYSVQREDEDIRDLRDIDEDPVTERETALTHPTEWGIGDKAM